MYQLFFQLQPKNIFFRDQKYFSKKNRPKIFFGENPEKNLKILIFRFFSILKIFTEKYFWPKKKLKNIFDPEKKIKKIEVEKKIGT